MKRRLHMMFDLSLYREYHTKLMKDVETASELGASIAIESGGYDLKWAEPCLELFKISGLKIRHWQELEFGLDSFHLKDVIYSGEVTEWFARNISLLRRNKVDFSVDMGLSSYIRWMKLNDPCGLHLDWSKFGTELETTVFVDYLSDHVTSMSFWHRPGWTNVKDAVKTLPSFTGFVLAETGVKGVMNQMKLYDYIKSEFLEWERREECK